MQVRGFSGFSKSCTQVSTKNQHHQTGKDIPKQSLLVELLVGLWMTFLPTLAITIITTIFGTHNAVGDVLPTLHGLSHSSQKYFIRKGQCYFQLRHRDVSDLSKFSPAGERDSCDLTPLILQTHLCKDEKKRGRKDRRKKLSHQ